MFARTLLELGKEYELKFYLSELERLYSITQMPEFGFQVGVIYSTGSFINFKIAKELFEAVIARSKNKDLRIKAKMFLARYYDFHEDTASCRQLVDSMETPDDVYLKPLVLVWQAKVLKDEGKFSEAHAILDGVIKNVSMEDDWYSYFSCRIILASLYIKEEKMELAADISRGLKEKFDGKNFKTLLDQIAELDKKLKDNDSVGNLEFEESEDILVLRYRRKQIEVESKSAIAKLLKLFFKRETISKETLIKTLYERDYQGEADNKLVYYHIHHFRKEMDKLGVPENAIEKDSDGYRMVLNVKIHNGEIL